MPDTLKHINRIQTTEEIRKALEKKFEAEWRIAELEIYKKGHQKKLEHLESELSNILQPLTDKKNQYEAKKAKAEKLIEESSNETEKEGYQEKLDMINDKLEQIDKKIRALTKESKLDNKSIKKQIKKENNVIDIIEKEQAKLNSKIVGIIPSDKLVDFDGPGCYVAHTSGIDVRLLKVATEEEVLAICGVESISDLIALRKVEETIFTGWQDTIDTCLKLEIKPGELFALAQTKGGFSEQLSENVRGELTAFANAYGRVSVTLAGIFAEVGLSGEVNVSIGTKYIAYNVKFYIKAQAGAYVSNVGVEASAGVEAGVEHSLGLKSDTKGKFDVEFNFKLRAYGKAEAKAMAKITGVGAGAAVSLGVAASIEGVLKHLGSPVGGIELEGAFEVEIGAKAEAEFGIGLKIGTPDNGGDVPMTVFEISISTGVTGLIGVSVGFRGAVKVATSLIDKIEEEIKKILEKAIRGILGEKVYAMLQEMMEEIDHYVSQVTSVIGHQTNNVVNLLDKGLILIQTEHKNKVRLGFQRHEKKLYRYKKHADDVLAKLEEKDVNDIEIGLILKSIEDPKLKAILKENFKVFDSRGLADLKLEFRKYAQKYQTRINKYNELINTEFLNYAERIEKHYDVAKEIIEELQAIDSITEDKVTEIRENLNGELDKINSLVDTFNLISTVKDEIISKSELYSSDNMLELDSEGMVELISDTYKKLKKDIKKLTALVESIKNSLV